MPRVVTPFLALREVTTGVVEDDETRFLAPATKLLPLGTTNAVLLVATLQKYAAVTMANFILRYWWCVVGYSLL
jgi:hypothetical protein